LETLNARDHLEDQEFDARIILKWILDWIRVAQDRDHWRAIVGPVRNLRVPLNAMNFLIS